MDLRKSGVLAVEQYALNLNSFTGDDLKNKVYVIIRNYLYQRGSFRREYLICQTSPVRANHCRGVGRGLNLLTKGEVFGKNWPMSKFVEGGLYFSFVAKLSSGVSPRNVESVESLCVRQMKLSRRKFTAIWVGPR